MNVLEAKSRILGIASLVLEAEPKEKWVTVHGTHIMIGKDGEVKKGPDAVKDSIASKPKQKAVEKHIEKIVGKDSGFETSEENGKVVIKNNKVRDEKGRFIKQEIEEKNKKKKDGKKKKEDEEDEENDEREKEDGPSILDTVIGLSSWIDTVRALAAKGILTLGRNIETILSHTQDAIDAWQSGSHGG